MSGEIGKVLLGDRERLFLIGAEEVTEPTADDGTAAAAKPKLRGGTGSGSGQLFSMPGADDAGAEKA